MGRLILVGWEWAVIVGVLLRNEAEEEEGQVREGPTGLAKMYVCNSQGVKGLPGGSVGKNPPAGAGDTGLIPGLGRSHMPRGS